MKIISHRSRLPAVVNLLVSVVVVGCGSGSPDSSSTPNAGSDVPEYQGDDSAEPPASDDTGSADEAPPAADPAPPVDEAIGDIALDPTDEPEPAADDTPMEVVEPEVPVITGPPPKFVGNITTGNSLDTN